MRTRTKLLLSAVAGTFLVTVLVVLLAVNWLSSGTRVHKPLEAVFEVGDPLFMRAVENLLGPPWTEGNSVKALRNGDEIFPAMLAAIRNARETINFETFVYWSGDIAVEFAHALAERARAGVQVNVLLDGLGASSMQEGLEDLMLASGVVVEFFRPLNWYHIDRLNNRTHRKFLIVDGEVGFTGGVGIGDEWLGDARGPSEFRDSHFEFRGPVVAQMQAGFIDHWAMTHHEIPLGEGYFPALKPQGEVVAQAFNSWGEGGADTVRSLFLLAIAGARESIRIGTPYFVPDDFLLDTLIEARERGVEIEIMTSGRNYDSLLAHGASRALWGDLLAAGARFYLFDPTLYHTKVLIVDEYFASVGSTNFDNRSFLHNDENQVNVLDRAFARDLIAQFERDKKRSRTVSLAEWLERPLRERVIEWWSMIFESQV